MKVCFLDHYDSFSFNLIDWLFSDGRLELEYLTIDDLARDDEKFKKMPLILSPGPHRPETLRPTVDFIKNALGTVPIFGICLGHQCLAYALDAKIVSAMNPFHGSAQPINLIKKSRLAPQLRQRFWAGHYNSLVVGEGGLPEEWIFARNACGEIAGFEWVPQLGYPAIGVQYHPESFLSEGQLPLKEAWIDIVRRYYDHLNDGRTI